MHRAAVATLVLCALATAGCRAGDAPPVPVSTAAHVADAAPRITRVASGLEHPWGLALLPDGRFLVTERPGRLRYVERDGRLSAPIEGVPAVWAQGQGGLLDVALAPDFASSRRVYLTYAEAGADGTAGTAAGYGVLDGPRLTGFSVIYRQEPKLEGPNHFGSRLAFDRAGHVFISQGERFQRMRAQDLSMLQGKLVRLTLDGAIPPDNPFVGRSDARPEIWSYGHRNVQSLSIDPRTGKLWEAEHGPRGGDEINLPQPGKNYGWPIASHGKDYATPFPYPETKGTDVPGMESPYHVWMKSPGLSGMAFYTGHPGSKWNDSLFLGALADRCLIRLTLDGDRIVSEERLLEDRKLRIRDVRIGADGAVYVLTDEDDGELLRLEPPR
ncbi:PQQ-dependent sugar dehydrogenase [Lysobacter sp. TY2-98]|uniref:PQQ-dependent sugar dehydrogenase n=1 Tax=Lysobacter sp. TY2-98 TaxID=2290922 RepID=UPI000E202627|nr:PQQ-dependent sugar dehydrogenase [Lysobacter sp. TY2-98]AXK71608.1 PQQ-dependent sugar dehydrogenase [Lysobacter sp. TY2-98]